MASGFTTQHWPGLAFIGSILFPRSPVVASATKKGSDRALGRISVLYPSTASCGLSRSLQTHMG
ncbi:uncharacterized protein RSE6_05780 [Rhynchosporium secalis]|uniref:Uncharacterized protein n=1 Tax=Rhynchosporium secalis TaxID=38038 RepID=A0A1E1M8R9_RHYSE|nr:uncharacterized protein RSE6_05780 [Rhynchosporium secalis]